VFFVDDQLNLIFPGAPALLREPFATPKNSFAESRQHTRELDALPRLESVGCISAAGKSAPAIMDHRHTIIGIT
jgi:hypothetical protein